MRKTIDVATLTDSVNEMLAAGWTSQEERRGMCLVLERVLFKTGNYRGYRYLTEREVPVGEKPGINPGEPSDDLDDRIARFKNTDGTRVEYYIKRD
jgi:hypothetical protein